MKKLFKNLNKNRKKLFLVLDKDNLIKIQQPDIKDVAILYSVILEKISKSNFC